MTARLLGIWLSFEEFDILSEYQSLSSSINNTSLIAAILSGHTRDDLHAEFYITALSNKNTMQYNAFHKCKLHAAFKYSSRYVLKSRMKLGKLSLIIYSI